MAKPPRKMTTSPEEEIPSQETPSSAATSPVRSTDGTEGAGLSTIPEELAEDVKTYRESTEGKKLVAWVISEFTKARGARTSFETEWRRNLAFNRGDHSGGVRSGNHPSSTKTPDQARRRDRVEVNRIRNFVRTEHSKFVSQEPTVSVVPSSSEDSDFRAASAGEQVYRSAISAGFLDTHFSEAAWWKVLTGNGFIKTYWDGSSLDPVSGETGTIRYGSVTPFHLYVPDLREVSLEEQPFVFNGYTKTLAWAKRRYPDLKDATAGDVTMHAQITNGVIPQVTSYPESVVVLEVWVKPGATEYLPDGGLLHIVGSFLVGITKTMPYQHGLYPYTHLTHLHTGGFYRDSSINDLVGLQREYNDLRTDLRRSARLMGRPQLAVQKGSYTAAKHTNEIGLLIEYNPGMQPPTPLVLPEVPAYVQSQQDRILADFDDLSGQHEVSRGQAPGRGVTAGTAIAYLQESDDQYLTPQYRADERAFEKIARQTLELFVQYVPEPRKIKSVGADRAFDTSLLSGADIRNGTDIRVEKGSTISTSQVARRAEIKEMVGMGLLTPEQGLELLELGGAERIKETFDIARGKAQRENIKMKNLTVADIMTENDEAVLAAQETLSDEEKLALIGPELAQPLIEEANAGIEEQDPMADPAADPMAAEEGMGEDVYGAEGGEPIPEGPSDEEISMMIEDALREMTPPIIPADDFDVHELHIEIHNQYRMSQEYEQLPDEVKEQFEKHIAMHTEMAQQAQRSQFLNLIPSDGTDRTDPETGEPAGPEEVPFGPAPFEQAQMDAEDGEQPMNPSRAQMLKGGVPPQTPGV